MRVEVEWLINQLCISFDECSQLPASVKELSEDLVLLPNLFSSGIRDIFDVEFSFCRELRF